MSKIFNIKKNSTLSLIKIGLNDKFLNKYNITNDMLENCVVTFSLRNADTGIFMIANVNAELLYLPDRSEYPDDNTYSVIYKIKKNQLNKVGRYYAEFAIDFLGDYCDKIYIPDNDLITVNILDSIVKTDII